MSALATIHGEELEQTVRDLAFPRHFVAEPEANRRAGDYLVERLKALGYSVTITGESRNVVALPAGLSRRARSSSVVGVADPLPWTLVGAHYDTVPGSPGADDNASAVAALLGCAAVASRYLPADAHVCFVAFNREEVQSSGQGLVGSTEFVRDYRPKSGMNVTAVHVLEMVGCTNDVPGSQATPPGLPLKLPDPGNWLGVVGNDRSAALVDTVLARARTYVPGFPVVGLTLPKGAEAHLPVLCRSDHAPFWAARIPALQWTDTAEFRNPRYHGAEDTPDTLDYAFLASVTRLVAACICGPADAR
jgi:Zn-dependent M28 family amino/carboxypeptidase